METLDQVLERAAGVAEKVLAPRAAEVDRAGTWPREGIRAILDEGLGGLAVPRTFGGLGLGLSGLARVSEIFGAACASTAMCFGMHCVGSAVIAAKATPEQVDTYLRPIVEGRHLTTLALSEPGSGSHFYIPTSRLDPHLRGGFALNGEKAFVTNGGAADSYVMSCASGGADAAVGRFTCVAVPAGAPGLSWGPAWNGIGMRGNASRRATLKDVPIPDRDGLGEHGDEIWYVFHVIAPYFLVAMTGTYVGVADAALREALEHVGAREHEHTGRVVGAETVVQHRLGELWARVESTRALLRMAAEAADLGRADAVPLILSAKAAAGDVAVDVANEALTLLGGRGYERGGAADRHLRDARAAHVMAPTTDILRVWTGRWILGRPLLAD